MEDKPRLVKRVTGGVTVKVIHSLWPLPVTLLCFLAV